MANGDIYLGESGSEELLSPFGRKLSIKDTYPIIREGRTSNGRYVRDIGGIKKKQFIIEYSEIDGSDLETILDIEDIQDELSLLIYTGVSEYDTYTVLMGPIERQRILLIGEGLWGGVSLTLNEV